jgi:hydrogenase maturation protein HypF
VAAELNLAGPQVAIVADGTGYGADGTMWGGEVLHGDSTGFTRIASLRKFPLVGGDAAVKEPWRIALALLHEAMRRRYPTMQTAAFGHAATQSAPG